MVLILFGVSGAGKTTIGRLLATRLGWRFEDADDYHSAANRQKMESGMPLTDEDRQPWLNLLHARIEELISCNENAVLACSALKQKYRDLLAQGFDPDQVRFALLDAPRHLLEERIRKRHHRYMNPGLLESQLATLEVPADAWRISVGGTEEEGVRELLGHLKMLLKSDPSETQAEEGIGENEYDRH